MSDIKGIIAKYRAYYEEDETPKSDIFEELITELEAALSSTVEQGPVNPDGQYWKGYNDCLDEWELVSVRAQAFEEAAKMAEAHPYFASTLAWEIRALAHKETK